MNDLAILSVPRPPAKAASNDGVDAGMYGRSYRAPRFPLGAVLALTLLGCSVANERKEPAVATPSQKTNSGPQRMTGKVKLFALPGSPRETMSLMLEALSSGNFGRLHDRFMATQAAGPENPDNDRNAFTWVLYEFGECADNPQPAGTTLGIFQCPPGKNYRRYGASGGPVDASGKPMNISVQNVENFYYRIRDLLPAFTDAGFAVLKDTYHLRPIRPLTIPLPFRTTEFLAEKPYQMVLISYHAGAPDALPNVLVQGLDIYVIEE